MKAHGACQIWEGQRDKDGYGRVTIDGKKLHAHRIAFETHVGAIPEGFDVCHKCDNPPCVRPSHLFAAPHVVNMRDAVAKNRTAHGTRNGRVKLTESDVRSIVINHRLGVSQAELARRFGVHKRTVADILHGKIWRRVTATIVRHDVERNDAFRALRPLAKAGDSEHETKGILEVS